MCVIVRQHDGKAMCTTPVSKWEDNYVCYCKTTWREGNVHNSSVKMRGQLSVLL